MYLQLQLSFWMSDSALQFGLFFVVFILMFFMWCPAWYFYICATQTPVILFTCVFLFLLKQVKRKIKSINRRLSTIVWKHRSIIDTSYFVAIMWPGQSKFTLFYDTKVIWAISLAAHLNLNVYLLLLEGWLNIVV